MIDLQKQFGEIDIYLFDQLLRGRIDPGARILDAGCGAGRNLVYLLRQGYPVFGVDQDAANVATVQALAAILAPNLPASNFREENIQSLSFPDGYFDAVISSAVLHFAENPKHFRAMLHGCWRVLKPGGLFFCRLASSIGIEQQIKSLGAGRYQLPDGSERFLVDERLLARSSNELGGDMIDPLKTTIVQNERSMTTWVLRKRVNREGLF